MEEHPIIFNTEMVKAILDGKKTQTRRVIKPQPFYQRGILRWDKNKTISINMNDHSDLAIPYCPYGQVGGKLWVKETFDYVFGDEGDYILYKANDADLKHFEELKKAGIKVTWNPSIFMPKDLSRITLDIIEVRVEGLHNITEEDIKAEGIEDNLTKIGFYYAFGQLWNSINAKRGYGWDTNPFVWVISFKVI